MMLLPTPKFTFARMSSLETSAIEPKLYCNVQNGINTIFCTALRNENHVKRAEW